MILDRSWFAFKCVFILQFWLKETLTWCFIARIVQIWSSALVHLFLNLDFGVEPLSLVCKVSVSRFVNALLHVAFAAHVVKLLHIWELFDYLFVHHEIGEMSWPVLFEKCNWLPTSQNKSLISKMHRMCLKQKEHSWWQSIHCSSASMTSAKYPEPESLNVSIHFEERSTWCCKSIQSARLMVTFWTIF